MKKTDKIAYKQKTKKEELITLLADLKKSLWKPRVNNI